MIYLIDSSDVPSQQQIEASSKNLWGLNKNADDTFFMSYNNLLFLQTDNKV